MIIIKPFIFNPFQENTYLLHDETGECIIIDSGCFSRNEEEELLAFINSNSLKPVKILNTHGHIDHIFGNSFLQHKFNIKIFGHKADDFLIENAVQYGSSFGIDIKIPPKVNVGIEENSIVKFGNSELKVIHVPGHTPGGIAFYNEEQKFVIVGDVLFNLSIGRTDLPGGDYQTLITSINSKLMTLPSDTIVYSGHGPSTTIGEEMESNPFL
ncbi:MAG: MBL fold metallo-hydrolase [Bacteroidia bacterium]|nr:MBL fold metallo-hydrolase [Bacteroidia bacterium]